MQKKDYLLNFEEFANLLYAFGFIKIPYDAKIIEEEEKKDGKNSSINPNISKKDPNQSVNQSLKEANLAKINQTMLTETHEERVKRFKRKMEANMLKDAWKLLTNGKPEAEKVDSNQIIVFCASILGLYNGEKPEKHKSEDVILKTEGSTTKPFILKTEESVNPTELTDKNGEKPNNATEKLKKGQADQSPKLPTKTKDKALGNNNSVYAFGSTSRLDPRKQTGTMSTASLRTVSQVKKGKEKRTLLKMTLPDLNLSKYSYHSKTVKEIHSIFHQFYVNRVEFLVDAKKKASEEKVRSNSANSASNIILNRSGFTIGSKSTRSAQRWRNKILDVLIIIVYLIYNLNLSLLKTNLPPKIAA